MNLLHESVKFISLKNFYALAAVRQGGTLSIAPWGLIPAPRALPCWVCAPGIPATVVARHGGWVPTTQDAKATQRRKKGLER